MNIKKTYLLRHWVGKFAYSKNKDIVLFLFLRFVKPRIKSFLFFIQFLAILTFKDKKKRKKRLMILMLKLRKKLQTFAKILILVFKTAHFLSSFWMSVGEGLNIKTSFVWSSFWRIKTRKNIPRISDFG